MKKIILYTLASVMLMSCNGRQKEEKSAEIRERVNRARAVQTERFKGTGVTCNAKMTPRLTRKFCVLSPDADALLKQSFDSLGLSPRAYDKILRISRTIADLDEAEDLLSRAGFDYAQSTLSAYLSYPHPEFFLIIGIFPKSVV